MLSSHCFHAVLVFPTFSVFEFRIPTDNVVLEVTGRRGDCLTGSVAERVVEHLERPNHVENSGHDIASTIHEYPCLF